MGTYQQHARLLADSRLSDADMRRLYIMDSTTISLFKDILQGVGRNPKEGRKKGAYHHQGERECSLPDPLQRGSPA